MICFPHFARETDIHYTSPAYNVWEGKVPSPRFTLNHPPPEEHNSKHQQTFANAINLETK